MAEMRSDAKFAQSGMRVEMVATKDGMTVRLTQASGSVIKTMTADEFLKLHDAASGDKTTRGKILDQKF
jgi:hypothetical protein